MQRVLALSLLSLAAAALPAQSQATTKTRHTSTGAASTKNPSTHAHTAAASSKAGTRTRSSRAKGKKLRAKAAPSYQLHPDPERYGQIQQALADRGYYKGQVNGEWGDDSVQALKQFQTDQKLDSDGKINSLSLIGLGLGPKHDGSTGRSAPVPGASADHPVAIVPPASDGAPSAPTPPN